MIFISTLQLLNTLLDNGFGTEFLYNEGDQSEEISTTLMKLLGDLVR